MILAIRTDKPEAELHVLDAAGETLAKHTWEAHRQLAATLVTTIESFLSEGNTKASELSGIVIFTGAGSFTGLRIGTTVANALAYAHTLPIVYGEGEGWIADGFKKLTSAKPEHYVTPKYDKEPNITQPR